MGFLDSLGGGSIGLIGGAIGALGGLFGGSHTKSFGSAGDLSSGRGELGQLGALSGQYSNLAGQDLSQYGADNGQYQSALGGYENYLKTDPYSDTYSTAALAGGTAGTAAAYQRANANLQAGAAGRGIGGGDSSILAGGQAALSQGVAGSMAQAQNNIALQRVAQHGQNLATLASLTGGVAGTDYSRGLGALGSETGIDSGLASSYLGLGQSELGMEQGYQQQQRQSLGADLGGLGSALGSYAYYNQPHPSSPYGSPYALSDPYGLGDGSTLGY